ncbi:MAG: cation:proton antiporter [Pseudomonadota bacterium]
MSEMTLFEVAILLSAMAIAAPLARMLGIGSVLGYLIAGVLMGPQGLLLAFGEHEAETFLHAAEFGVVLLLFLIGLELRPKRLWAMRTAIFGAGTLQVIGSGLLLTSIGLIAGLPPLPALFAGLALALSSTAFAVQVLEENGELQMRHGRLGFAVLLFQDLAAIPLIAFAPLFAVAAVATTASTDALAILKPILAIAALVIGGYFILDRALQLIARTKVREAMTAAALLTVVGAALLMQSVGLSASLGAFIAGALLAESSYRHQLEADIQPFEGLLLGLFFTAVGMSLDLTVLLNQPVMVIALTVLLVAIKAGVLFAIGRWQGLTTRPARRLGLSLSQAGEFGFVLLTAGVAGNVLDRETSALLGVVITMSMATTPLLLLLDRHLLPEANTAPTGHDEMPDEDGHVVIAGFGRYGQITARILRAKGIPFTALDLSAEQIALVANYGSKAFFGDASRPDILEAAQTSKAKAFVLAIDDVEASLRTAKFVRETYPDLPIFARARNRRHAHELMDLGIMSLERETFRSALATAGDVLVALGYSKARAGRALEIFQNHDEKRLTDDYAYASDVAKIQDKARSDADQLAQIFRDDLRDDDLTGENPLKPVR